MISLWSGSGLQIFVDPAPVSVPGSDAESKNYLLEEKKIMTEVNQKMKEGKISYWKWSYKIDENFKAEWSGSGLSWEDGSGTGQYQTRSETPFLWPRINCNFQLFYSKCTYINFIISSLNQFKCQFLIRKNQNSTDFNQEIQETTNYMYHFTVFQLRLARL